MLNDSGHGWVAVEINKLFFISTPSTPELNNWFQRTTHTQRGLSKSYEASSKVL